MTETAQQATWATPAKLREVVDTALNAGRSLLVSHGADTAGSPFVLATVKWDRYEIRLTWHTRDTGSYRLFSAIAAIPGRNWHDITAARAVELIGGAA